MQQRLTILFNTNHFVNNDMHSGIITTDISNHLFIFLISKELMLDFKRKQYS